METVTYALLKKQISGLGSKVAGMMPGYKGVVTNETDLPSDAEEGDMYIVTSEGNMHYYFDGSDWSIIDPAVATNAQIDGLY